MNNTNFSALAEGLDVRGSNLTELAETLICNNSNPWCRLFFEPNVSVVCSSLEFACRTSPLCRRISDYSCKDLLDCNCPPLTGDSDIAGTGVCASASLKEEMSGLSNHPLHRLLRVF